MSRIQKKNILISAILLALAMGGILFHGRQCMVAQPSPYDTSQGGIIGFLIQVVTGSEKNATKGPGTGEPPAMASYSIGGNISGLTATGLQLQLAGEISETLAILSSGSYAFTGRILETRAYHVSILAQPSGQYCAIIRNSGNVSATNVTDVDVLCTGTPPDTVGYFQALVTAVNINGEGKIATVYPGNSFSVSLNLAVDGAACSGCISPVLVGIHAFPAPAPSFQAFCGWGNYSSPAEPIYIPGNPGNLTAPMEPGVYLITVWNTWDFCPTMTLNFSTQGTPIGVLIVPSGEIEG